MTYIHLNGSFQYSQEQLVALAKSIKNHTYAGDITVQLTPFELCNYNCSFCNQAGLAKDKELFKAYLQGPFADKAFKSVNVLLRSLNKRFPKGRIKLFIIGGEVTMLPIELLNKLLAMCTEGVDRVSTLITTNLFRNYQYYATLKGLNEINASFHTSVLSNHAKQEFLSKALLLKVNGKQINVTHLINKKLEPTCNQLKAFTRLSNGLVAPWYSWCIENGNVDTSKAIADSDFISLIKGDTVSIVSTYQEFGMPKDKVLSSVSKTCAPFGWVGLRIYEDAIEYDCSSNCQSSQWPTTKSEFFGKPLRQMIKFNEIEARSNEFIDSILLGSTPRKCSGLVNGIQYTCNACGSFMIEV